MFKKFENWRNDDVFVLTVLLQLWEELMHKKLVLEAHPTSVLPSILVWIPSASTIRTAIIRMVTVEVVAIVSTQVHNLIAPIMAWIRTKEKNFLLGYKVIQMARLTMLRPFENPLDLKPCPIWIARIIVENEVVQYWTPWEHFEIKLWFSRKKI